MDKPQINITHGCAFTDAYTGKDGHTESLGATRSREKTHMFEGMCVETVAQLHTALKRTPTPLLPVHPRTIYKSREATRRISSNLSRSWIAYNNLICMCWWIKKSWNGEFKMLRILVWKGEDEDSMLLQCSVIKNWLNWYLWHHFRVDQDRKPHHYLWGKSCNLDKRDPLN